LKVFRELGNCVRFHSSETTLHLIIKTVLANLIWRAHIGKKWAGATSVETEVKYGNRVIDVVDRINRLGYEIETNLTKKKKLEKGKTVKGQATETGIILRDIIVIDASQIPSNLEKMKNYLSKYVF